MDMKMGLAAGPAVANFGDWLTDRDMLALAYPQRRRPEMGKQNIYAAAPKQ